ncbi:MAG: hypothetical protein JWN33_576 [Candidatus Saccharibacteria bacterium]|nr:hypothetical protein [Candidatus Saccharibacteria bacterium]
MEPFVLEPLDSSEEEAPTSPDRDDHDADDEHRDVDRIRHMELGVVDAFRRQVPLHPFVDPETGEGEEDTDTDHHGPVVALLEVVEGTDEPREAQSP